MNDIIWSSKNDADVNDFVLSAVLNERRWPNAQVPFELDSSYSNNKAILIVFFSYSTVSTNVFKLLFLNSADGDRAVIAKGMSEYHKNTCIRFVPRTTEQDYLSIARKMGKYNGTRDGTNHENYCIAGVPVTLEELEVFSRSV